MPTSSAEGGITFDIDIGELGLVVLAIAALLFSLAASLWIIYDAPVFFAELLLDTALGAGLYRRFKGLEERHWLTTALGKTALPFLGIEILFIVLGSAMQMMVPGANTVGEVFFHFRP